MRTLGFVLVVLGIFGLLIGLLWAVVFSLTQGQSPLQGIQSWNLAIALVVALWNVLLLAVGRVLIKISRRRVPVTA